MVKPSFSIKRLFANIFMALVVIVGANRSWVFSNDQGEQVRAYTRMVEFDYVSWTLDALLLKIQQASLGIQRQFDLEQQRQTVYGYLELVQEIQVTRAEMDRIYSDPAEKNPKEKAAPLVRRWQRLQTMQQIEGPLVESILQEQVGSVVAEMGLSFGGRLLPPLLYHSTPLPMALIVSPRSVIRQDTNISLLADLNTEDVIRIEKEVENGLDVSALVVPIGGVGIYPTMVMQTTDLPWLVDTIAHEWTHNYLTLRPLGMNYDATAELRTMNETTASLAGKEIGEAVLKKYYPELAPQPVLQTATPQVETPTATPQTPEPPVFDFRKEMHDTRVTVDSLLSEGKIEEAETYMETRRKLMWDNGYQIRRLNQAYFAFYGAYADVAGGAAGSDPVGPAVVGLRQQSKDLADFINRIAWMTSFAQLQQALQAP